MPLYSEAQFYKDILTRNLTDEQLIELQKINDTEPIQERAIIRSDPTDAVKRRKRQLRDNEQRYRDRMKREAV